MNDYPAWRRESHSTARWSEERVATLKTLWADGLSASQCAAELGGITRNAVIGKVMRLGLAGRKTVRTAAKKPRRPRAPRLGRVALISGLTKLERAAFAPPPEPTPIAEQEIPANQRRSLLELTALTCKWPIGDPQRPDFFFCGGATDHGPYCAYHSSVAGAGYGRSLARLHRAI